jgi:hypothetical protein
MSFSRPLVLLLIAADLTRDADSSIKLNNYQLLEGAV